MKERIGLIGPGKLGLCVALLLEESGHEVIAVETNHQYLELLQKKTLDSPEPEVNNKLSLSKIEFTDDLKILLQQELRNILIYVPTPNSDAGYDHGILEDVLNQLIASGKQNQPVTIMVGCTTLPGFCAGYSERLAALNYELIYSPSFIAQGSIIQNLQHPDILLFGSDSGAESTTTEEIMNSITLNKPTIHHMDLLSAEITKLATNCFLTSKIAFANAIGDLAVQAGADHDLILKAVGNDARIGNEYLRYGFGYGGPCFPRDNRALNYFAGQNDFDLSISEATEKSNEAHALFQVNEYLRTYDPEEIIYFDHVSYKPNSDILEESQQLKIALALTKKGRKVSVTGSASVIEQLKKKYGKVFIYASKNE